MPLLPLISFLVAAAIWLAVLLSVLTEGFHSGQRLWFEIFFLIAPPLLAYRSWLRIRAARGELGRASSAGDANRTTES